MGLCDIQDIKEILGRHGFRFSKALGQNFLTEAWVPARIAAECGFSSESYFHSYFKRSAGISPGEYRRIAKIL